MTGRNAPAAGERRQALDAAWRDVDIADGTLRPRFVYVPDGHYTQRIVLDSPLVAGPAPEGANLPAEALAFHYEPCRIPRHRTELVWERVSDNGGREAPGGES